MKTIPKVATKKNILESAAQAIASAKETAKRRLAQLPAAALDERAANQLTKGLLPGHAWTSAYLSYDGYSAHVTLRVESIKDDPVVNAILKRAVRRDLPVKTEDYVTSDWAERSFYITLPMGGTLRLEVEPSSTSESCRKVQVGVEVKEVAKYELRCN